MNRIVRMAAHVLAAGACLGAAVLPAFSQVRPVSPRLEEMREASRLAGVDESAMQDRKCGFGWSAALAGRIGSLDEATAARVNALLQPSATMADTIIGRFQIFFDSSGVDAPALIDGTNNRIPGTARAYIDSVGRILNEVWQEEVTRLGFDAPPLESAAYQITIREFGGSIYGQTIFLTELPGAAAPRYTSRMELDNDYREFGTKGMDGLKVTAAHEFHHAIQIGAYGFWGLDEQWAYELTSTWAESRVYPQINDYLQYVPDFFAATGFASGLSLGNSLYPGYERCVWGQFLAKRFGLQVLTDIWQQMRSVRFLAANERALLRLGSSLSSAYADFSYWNYFTAEHADTARYYSNGLLLPRFERTQRVPFNGSAATANANVYPLSTIMTDFRVGTSTLTFVTSNADARASLAGDGAARGVSVSLTSSKPDQPYRVLRSGLYAGFLAADHTVWRSFVMDSSASADAPSSLGDPFPNPVRLATDDALVLPVDAAVGEPGDVLVVTASFDRVLSGTYPVVGVQGSNGIRIPVADLRKNAGTGIHFVSARVAGRDLQWKVLLVQ